MREEGVERRQRTIPKGWVSMTEKKERGKKKKGEKTRTGEGNA